jgi:nitrate/nitrite-specific signal transduction histidine kinase
VPAALGGPLATFHVAAAGITGIKPGIAAFLHGAAHARDGPKIDLQAEGTERLMPLDRQELPQIAQEAFNNALTHPHERAGSWLDFHGSATRLEVSDDGCGLMLFPGRPP